MRKLLLLLMAFAFAIPIAIAGEKTVTISRNEGIYDDGTGVYYCTKDGITMTFSSGLNNVNYLVEHQQVVFYIKSDNYVIKKIKFNCLDNTTNSNLDCFYWGPSTIHELEQMATYTPTGTYTYSGYIGTWVAGPTDSKDVKFRTEGKPVRFGSVEITYDKEFGDIYDLVTSTNEIAAGQTYALVSKQSSRALGKVENHTGDDYETFSSTPVTLLNYDQAQNNYLKVKVTDEVQLIKLERAVSTTTTRPWHLKVGDNYIRRRNGSYTSGSGTNKGYNLFAVPTLPTDEFSLYSFRVSISFGTNSNALLKFYHPSGDNLNSNDMAIRHYNGGSLFRVMDSGSSNSDAVYQRVYLYKPAQTYYVTTNCLPNNDSGYITLGEGVLNDGNGNYTSQQFDNVSFFVGPTEGWGVGAVTVTNLSTNEVTTLTPTNTSDFGNDYQFPMPGANVSVTANFLQPFNIDTICNPSDGGQFNFINGYTNFSGQYYSNEGKTVTFKPSAADGFIFQSVTITDNGVTTTMTPDANGVYSFVMPSNGVTLTANFEEAHDLYLLGTANGQTAWHPYGPKFTFDGENQVYYIDVYFKGDSLYNNGQGDPYGHFSLTRMISSNPNENTGWGEISGSRIYATSLDYWVEDGNTYNNCFQTSTDYAFKIPAGVYRITVGKDLDYMSIAEYEPTLVFTPAGGDANNPTVVALNTEVVITSNLEQLVHDINPNETSHATFYNTTDNWATNEHDNTRVISDYDVTTVIANVNLGYIKKEDNASYEVVSDLYLLGTANGMNSWQPYGPQFTYDANTETYTLDVYFTGTNVTAADEGYGYFSLSKVISDPQNPNWSDIPSSARYNAQYNDVPITGLAYNQSTTENLYQTDPNWCFKIEPGVYTITVNKDKTEMTVTKHELTLTFNPVSGTTVAAGDPVNIYSNLEQVVHAINPDEPLHATFSYATSTDGTLPTPDTAGSTVNITAVGATTTVNAQAALGYIVVPGNADYIVPAPAVYSITTIVNPEGAGTITAPADATVGTTVTFTVSTNEGYQLDQVQVTYGSNLAILDYTYNSETGEYSFVMPNDEVRIYADYTRQSHGITTVVNPEGAGTINVAADAFAGETVNFTVDPNTGYSFNGEVTVTYTDGSTGTITVTDNGDGTYSFVMPNKDVTITANFALKGEIFRIVTKNSEIVEGKTYIYVSQGHDLVMARANPYAFCGNADIIEWVTPDKRKVKVDGRAAFFKPYLLADTTVGESTLKASYLKTLDGNYLGLDAMSRRIRVIPELSTYDNNIRSLMSMRFHQKNLDSDSEYYYVYARYKGNSNPMIFDETFHFTLNNNVPWSYSNHVNLYKLAESYNITSDCTPTGSGQLQYSGQVTGTTAIDGDTVIVTPVANQGYAFDDVTGITVTVDDTGETVEVTVNEDGTYSFVMPIGDVTVSATFVTGYTITTICDPDGGGRFEGILYPSAYEGQIIDFSVIPNDNYVLESVTYVYEDSGNEETADFLMTEPEDGNRTFGFEFDMPAENVTIIAHFVPAHHVTCVVMPISNAGGIVTGHDTDFGFIQDSYFAYEDNVYVDVSQNPGYQLDSVTVTRDDNGQHVTLSDPFYDEEMNVYYLDFVMPDADVTVTAYFSVNTPLSFIEYPGTFNDGDEVMVSDTLIGTWVAKQYLWAKDQAPYVSNFYLEKSEDEDVHDYLREYYRLQYRDWDQSNWVMLDFSTIPELAGYSQQQLMDVMNDYVDNQIVGGSIKGVYKCVESAEPFGIFGEYARVKIQHIIELSELPQYVKAPATIGPNNTLGYPGFQNDPQEKEGKYYATPKANYAYNHYTPANFIVNNTVSDGIDKEYIDEFGVVTREYRMFFMRPKDQEVVQVWAVWFGEFENYYDQITNEHRPEGDNVFAVYQYDPAAGINTLNIQGAFRVGSWDYNINETDGAGKPIGYGKPETPLRKDCDYTFHAAVQYSPYIAGPPQAPRRVNGVASTIDPQYYNVYPLDMTSPEETYTGVKEVVSREATTIVDIRYYNIMGQESMTPFDGINIMVIRYKDGSFKSMKVLK